MKAHFVTLIAIGLTPGASWGQSPADSAGFVTTLGRDTVALESFIRTANRVEGQIVGRVPGTVLIRYELELAADDPVVRSVLRAQPWAASDLVTSEVMLDLQDSARTEVDSAGPTTGLFTTGFGSAYGLYASLGRYELTARAHSDIALRYHDSGHRRCSPRLKSLATAG